MYIYINIYNMGKCTESGPRFADFNSDHDFKETIHALNHGLSESNPDDGIVNVKKLL